MSNKGRKVSTATREALHEIERMLEDDGTQKIRKPSIATRNALNEIEEMLKDEAHPHHRKPRDENSRRKRRTGRQYEYDIIEESPRTCSTSSSAATSLVHLRHNGSSNHSRSYDDLKHHSLYQSENWLDHSLNRRKGQFSSQGHLKESEGNKKSSTHERDRKNWQRGFNVVKQEYFEKFDYSGDANNRPQNPHLRIEIGLQDRNILQERNSFTFKDLFHIKRTDRKVRPQYSMELQQKRLKRTVTCSSMHICIEDDPKEEDKLLHCVFVMLFHDAGFPVQVYERLVKLKTYKRALEALSIDQINLIKKML